MSRNPMLPSIRFLTRAQPRRRTLGLPSAYTHVKLVHLKWQMMRSCSNLQCESTVKGRCRTGTRGEAIQRLLGRLDLTSFLSAHSRHFRSPAFPTESNGWPGFSFLRSQGRNWQSSIAIVLIRRRGRVHIKSDRDRWDVSYQQDGNTLVVLVMSDSEPKSLIRAVAEGGDARGFSRDMLQAFRHNTLSTKDAILTLREAIAGDQGEFDRIAHH